VKFSGVIAALKIAFGLIFLAGLVTTAWAQSFTLSVTPSTVTIHPGDNNIPVTVSVGSSTYTGPINITFSGLPSGISVAPLALNAGSSGMLNISASVSADQEAFPANNPANPNSVTNTVAGSTVVSVPMLLIVSLVAESLREISNRSGELPGTCIVYQGWSTLTMRLTVR
jgi:hypothetical protein